MTNLKDLRRRIKSVSQTQKITAAMKMISAARFRKAQHQLVAARLCESHSKRPLHILLQQEKYNIDVPTLLTGVPEGDEIIVIAITSDRGLCGGYNHNIIKKTKQFIQGTLAPLNKKLTVISIGRRGFDLLKSDMKGDIRLYHLIDSSEERVMDLANTLLLTIEESLVQNKLAQVWVSYTEFHTVLRQEAVIKKLIPYDLEPHTKEQNLFSFEPDLKKAGDYFARHYLKMLLGEIMMEAYASEHGARMTAMDNASRNAKEMIDNLKLTYNSTRQGLITKELIEIISGANTL